MTEITPYWIIHNFLNINFDNDYKSNLNVKIVEMTIQY